MSNRISTGILRAVTGAWILNSGVGKLKLDKAGAEQLQHAAEVGVPEVKNLDPVTFGRLLSYTEILLGAGLLAPMVNRRLIGLALTGFASGMLTMYFRNPEMTEDDGFRPTHKGIALSKDMWLAAIGLAMVLSSRTKRTKKIAKSK